VKPLVRTAANVLRTFQEMSGNAVGLAEFPDAVAVQDAGVDDSAGSEERRQPVTHPFRPVLG